MSGVIGSPSMLGHSGLTGKFAEWFADENNNFNGDRSHDAVNKGLPIHL